jgi:hypothetical protein
MPRQPFRFSGFQHYLIGHDCLIQRPHLAAIIAGCNDLWSNVELQLSLTLGAILNSNSPAAVGVYLSIQNSRAQRDALLAAAKLALNQRDLAVFECVLSLHKRYGDERNSLMHGIFGLTNEDPDILLWQSSAKHAAWLIETYRREGQMEDFRPHEKLREEMFVYKKQDLIDIYDDLAELRWATFYLHTYLQPIPSARPAPAKAPILANLCALSRIRKELDRMGYDTIPTSPP